MLSTAGEVRTNLHMDTLVLTTKNLQLGADTGCSLEDVPGAMSEWDG